MLRPGEAYAVRNPAYTKYLPEAQDAAKCPVSPTGAHMTVVNEQGTVGECAYGCSYVIAYKWPSWQHYLESLSRWQVVLIKREQR